MPFEATQCVRLGHDYLRLRGASGWQYSSVFQLVNQPPERAGDCIRVGDELYDKDSHHWIILPAWHMTNGLPVDYGFWLRTNRSSGINGGGPWFENDYRILERQG